MVPDALLMQDENISAYVYVEDDTSGVTVFEVRIPVIPRPRPTTLYTPEQIDSYNKVVAELGTAIQEVTDMKSEIEETVQAAQDAAEIANQAVDAVEQAVLDAEKAVSDAQEAIDNLSLDWNNVENKPEAFPPDTHGHDSSEISGVLPIEKGGTGATTAEEARKNLGITATGSSGDVGSDHTHDEYALADHTHDEYALVDHAHSEYADKIHEHTADEVNARPSSWTPSISDIEGLSDALLEAGKVKTINGNTPDENGNVVVEFTAKDVGALYVSEDNQVMNGDEEFSFDTDKISGKTLEDIYNEVLA